MQRLKRVIVLILAVVICTGMLQGLNLKAEAANESKHLNVLFTRIHI